ncbi:MAG TPA: hypothetical protein VF190_08825 [Rhodothermales bacterium]
MGRPHREEDLEIEESVDFQRAEWRAERIGWVAMAIVIAFAALGFFGGAGPFERKTLQGEGVSIEIDRFTRYQAPAVMRFFVEAGATKADTVAVWVSSAYLDGVQVNDVTPEPVAVTSDASRVVYTFQLSGPGAGLRVTFHLMTQSIGLRRGTAGVFDGEPLSFSQFTYP